MSHRFPLKAVPMETARVEPAEGDFELCHVQVDYQ